MYMGFQSKKLITRRESNVCMAMIYLGNCIQIGAKYSYSGYDK